ncbi:hypothetical protein [Clostridium sp. AWRP]|uniref:hypothetical protein n=1 Tax=Clostridium sp. AWRP TaxID=2212991 RepID=UPI000FDB8CF2|nr:hypothetical protein [Clostridium sp. AWRP]AZV58366.1 hypothetical protein DMR38_18220 [Clostridium sp. AWRP]
MIKIKIKEKFKKKMLKLKSLFYLALTYIIFYKTYELLGNLDEIFKYGNIIYNIIKSILSVGNIIASSLIGSIIFYYIIEFKNFNDNWHNYIDLKSCISFSIDYNIQFVKNVKGFGKLITNNDMAIRKIDDTLNQISITMNNIEFIKNNRKQLKVYLYENKSELENMKKYFNKSIKYFKDGQENISKMQFKPILELYKSLYHSKNVTGCFRLNYDSYSYLSMLVDIYIEHLDQCTKLYYALCLVIINHNFIGFANNLENDSIIEEQFK